MKLEEKESFLINTYEDSSQTAKKFLSIFFSKCKTKQADSDFRPILENFIQDLLITVNKPEWPVSEIILNLLGMILVSQIQSEQNDVSSRVNSLEYLGQIVSQLRKDSLEYQKYPEKVSQVLNKINGSDQSKEDELFSLQKSLITYLNSLEGNDSSLQYSKFFLVGQWLKELNSLNAESSSVKNDNEALDHGQERMNKQIMAEENRKRLYSLIEKATYNKPILDSNNIASSNVQLDMNEAFILSKYLCSLKKTLDKNFDKYLITILGLSGGASESNIPTQVRSKAIKCLSLIIEADPQILLKQKVFQCVEANFLHQTISVREASVDLIGRFITIKPELTNHYYKLLSDRILDVGVSVRKRVIKIFRDVCLNQPEFEHLSEICVRILRRINDEDAIKKLVIDTFYSIWFSPINSSNSREQLVRRVLNIVDVVSEFNSIANNTQSSEIFEQLFNSLIVTTTPSGSAGLSGISSLTNGLNIKEEKSKKPKEEELKPKEIKIKDDPLITNENIKEPVKINEEAIIPKVELKPKDEEINIDESIIINEDIKPKEHLDLTEESLNEEKYEPKKEKLRIKDEPIVANEQTLKPKDEIVSKKVENKIKEEIIKSKDEPLKSKVEILKHDEKIKQTDEPVIVPEEISKLKDDTIKRKEIDLEPNEKIILTRDLTIKPKEEVEYLKEDIITPKEDIITPKKEQLNPLKDITKLTEEVLYPKEDIITPKEEQLKTLKDITKLTEEVKYPKKESTEHRDLVIPNEEIEVKPKRVDIKIKEALLTRIDEITKPLGKILENKYFLI